MTQLTVPAKSQITLRKDLLQHLGLKPGDKVDVALMPDGSAEIRAARPQGSVDAFIGLLAAGGVFADGVIAHEGQWLEAR